MSESALNYDGIRNKLRRERLLKDYEIIYLQNKYMYILERSPMKCVMVMNKGICVSHSMFVADDNQQSVLDFIKQQIKDRTEYLNSLPVEIPGYLL